MAGELECSLERFYARTLPAVRTKYCPESSALTVHFETTILYRFAALPPVAKLERCERIRATGRILQGGFGSLKHVLVGVR